MKKLYDMAMFEQPGYCSVFIVVKHNFAFWYRNHHLNYKLVANALKNCHLELGFRRKVVGSYSSEAVDLDQALALDRCVLSLKKVE